MSVLKYDEISLSEWKTVAKSGSGLTVFPDLKYSYIDCAIEVLRRDSSNTEMLILLSEELNSQSSINLFGQLLTKADLLRSIVQTEYRSPQFWKSVIKFLRDFTIFPSECERCLNDGNGTDFFYLHSDDQSEEEKILLKFTFWDSENEDHVTVKHNFTESECKEIARNLEKGSFHFAIFWDYV